MSIHKFINMDRLTINMIANFFGRGWSALMGIVFIPLYINFMGIESYGLVGFFTTLQAVFAILNLGLSTTLNRELARFSVTAEKSQAMRDLVRTLEVVYWGLALSIGALVVGLSPFLARSWVNADTLPAEVTQKSLLLMGLVMAFQLPMDFYSGGLLGLQKQILYNVLNVAWSTLRFAGAAMALHFISPTIITFFEWQIMVSIISTGLMATALWRSLPPSDQRAKFRISAWNSVSRFAMGISGISITVLFLAQLDKIILSKILSLEFFGYYTLAWTVANGLTIITGSVFTAMFPVFSQHVASANTEELKRLYHRGCQLVSVLILPAAILVAFFAKDLLGIWIRDSSTVTNTYPLVRLLIIGTALNSLMNLPYALQLAYSWTSLVFYTNIISIIILVPALVVTTLYFGGIGAASVWIALNSGYVLIQVHIMHRRLLRGGQWRWYFEDVGYPMTATLSVISLGHFLIRDRMPFSILLVNLTILFAFALMSAVFAAPQIRAWFLSAIERWIKVFCKNLGKAI